MNDKQANQDKLFELTEKVEGVKNHLKLLQAELETVLMALGMDTYHQDPITGLVYKVYSPDGTFVSFRKIDYKRTSLPGEKGGMVLSKSEAQENGFVLNK